jgi:hypothetical protein
MVRCRYVDYQPFKDLDVVVRAVSRVNRLSLPELEDRSADLGGFWRCCWFERLHLQRYSQTLDLPFASDTRTGNRSYSFGTWLFRRFVRFLQQSCCQHDVVRFAFLADLQE